MKIIVIKKIRQKCTTCNKVKLIKDFSKRADKDRKGQYKSKCKSCERKRLSKYMKKYWAKNPNKKKEISDKHRVKYRVELIKKSKNYYIKNRTEILKKHAKKTKKAVDNLSDSYVKHALKRRCKISNETASSPLLIEAKRAQLMLHRMSKD